MPSQACANAHSGPQSIRFLPINTKLSCIANPKTPHVTLPQWAFSTSCSITASTHIHHLPMRNKETTV